MRKFSLILAFVLVGITYGLAQQAKYVFYFIGDGMGVNQVQATEFFQAELEGKVGISPLQFTQFPFATVAATYSGSNGVTDSAASGTALSTGHKTKNGTLGILKDGKTRVNSIGVWAKEAGHCVGIATSVTVDHATPAAFYAHVVKRNQYKEVVKDMYKAGFDFYAGSDFHDAVKEDTPADENPYLMAAENGYVIARGYKDYRKKSKKAEKMILLQTEEASGKSRKSIPFAIDRGATDLTLPDITRSAVNFLTKDPDKGFFLMVEGGEIDWACHSNDAATVFREIQDFDNAIKVAYEFYVQHPEETLIVVTADHETGGFALGRGTAKLNLQVLMHQKVSESGFTHIVNNLRAKYKNQVPWEALKEALKENFGFWNQLQLSESQEKRLKDIYDKSFKGQKVDLEKSLYLQNEPIAGEAKRIINEMAMVSWATGGHTAGYVPVFAIGAGAERFQGRLNNSDLPLRMAEAAGYTVK